MSGIVAAVSRAGTVRQDTLRRATACLRHRGPDAQHVWVSEDGRAGLGHAQLRIDGRETGDQPIANEDHRLHIVVDGELYDVQRMAGDLERAGHTLQTQSNAEIALHLYEDIGTRAIHALRGEFALAIWDARDRLLLAARDRFGIKPLYYTTHDETVYLASEIKAFEELGVPLRWNRESLYDHMFIAHPPDRCLFEGIYQVPPGCWLLTDGAQIRIVPYWDWDYPRAGDSTRDTAPGEWIERLRGAFEEAVRLRLRTDGPIAVALGDAIDSCAVLGAAARFSSQPLHAFTLAFEQAHHDSLAESQAAHSGAELHWVDVHPQDVADQFATAVFHAERPLVDARAVAKYLLNRAVRSAGIDVMLTSTGSDEALSLSSGSAKEVLGFMPPHHHVWAQFGRELLAVADDEFVEAFAGRDTYRVLLSHLDVDRQLACRHPAIQAQYILGKTVLPNYTLSSLGDRMEMAHSVEGRLPFLDHDLVRLAIEMPVSMRICGATVTCVLREIARPFLIDRILDRPKSPSMPPVQALSLRSPLYALVQDVLRSDALDGLGLFDRTKVVTLLDSLRSMDRAARARTNAALLWMTSVCVLGDQMGL